VTRESKWVIQVKLVTRTKVKKGDTGNTGATLVLQAIKGYDTVKLVPQYQWELDVSLLVTGAMFSTGDKKAIK